MRGDDKARPYAGICILAATAATLVLAASPAAALALKESPMLAANDRW